MPMNRLRLFRRDERGSAPIEGVMGALLLLSWYMIAFQFYDAFRSKSLAMRASYTVADAISRQKAAIGPDFRDGMKKLFDYMMANDSPDRSWLRITVIFCADDGDQDKTDYCNGTSKQFSIATDHGSTTLSSHGTTGVAPHTVTTLNAQAHRIPEMAEGDYAVVLETSTLYNPIFGIGNEALTLDGGKSWTTIGLNSAIRFSNFVVTRPRGPRTVWDANS
ncbi:MAG: hypothetical protein IE922_02215 [Sphingomonadales bacterium]|nr:hypothetical protein [Sphingomonadales bacterium]